MGAVVLYPVYAGPLERGYITRQVACFTTEAAADMVTRDLNAVIQGRDGDRYLYGTILLDPDPALVVQSEVDGE